MTKDLKVEINKVTFSDPDAIFTAIDCLVDKESQTLVELLKEAITKWQGRTTNKIDQSIIADEKTKQAISIVVSQELIPNYVKDNLLSVVSRVIDKG